MFSANSSQVSEDRLYVEDVFSTYLYTGNGSTQTITNGIDLAGKGGLVWVKTRSPTGYDNALFDTSRGVSRYLVSNNTDPSFLYSNFGVTAFNSNGFSLRDTGGYSVNTNNHTYASWTFREAPKFFDVVTYTGNGVSGRQIAHSLGVAPGCMIVKQTSGAQNWAVYHRSQGPNNALFLDLTNAATGPDPGYWNYTNPSATTFTVGNYSSVNANGATYVAYLFAHDTTSDGIIQCGSVSADANGYANVNLGWEPQWVLYKPTSTTGSWGIADVMRGMPASTTTTGAGNTSARIFANRSDMETAETNYVCNVNSTGFTFHSGSYASSSLIYIAIRRGPMRTPTSGTSVFNTAFRTTGSPNFISGFPVDMAIYDYRPGGAGIPLNTSRLTGTNTLTTSDTSAQSSTSIFNYDYQSGYGNGFSASTDVLSWMFRRAPSFFDVVCYTGTGATNVISHNLGAAPELAIFKQRSSSGPWRTFVDFGATTCKYLALNATDASSTVTYSSSSSVLAQPTATNITIGTLSDMNGSGSTYVAYLFASCPGVSKVFSFTGNGSSQTINCGFSGGARFILIKRTDSTGNWVVFDSARGIVSGNDPSLLLNSTAAETNYDDIDPDSSGFIVNQSTNNLNVNGASYVGIAIS